MSVSFTAQADSWQVPSSPYANRKWRAAIVVSGNDEVLKKTISVKLYFDGGYVGNWGQVGKYISGYIQIGTNKKSVAEGDQSWNYTDLNEKLVLSYSYTFNKTEANQTIKIKGAVKVNSPSAYRTGSTSTVEYNVSVSALKSFTINFNGNGGTNQISSPTLPETRTYYYNKATFSTNGLPDYTGGTWNLTKTNYQATGNWQTAQNGGTLISQSKTFALTQNLYKEITGTAWDGTKNGGSITLYAGWKLNYVPPKIGTITFRRVSESGSTTEDPEGQVLWVTINYTHGVLGGITQALTIKVFQVNESNPILTDSLQSTASSPYNGYIESNPSFDKETSYQFTVSLSNQNQTPVNSGVYTVPAVKYPIDLKVEDSNVYMGVMHTAVSGNILTIPGLVSDGTIKSTAAGTTETAAFYAENSIDKTDTFFTAQRIDKGTIVNFGVGSGGENHGVYSPSHSGWIVYADTTTAALRSHLGYNRTSTTTSAVGTARWESGYILARQTSGSSKRFKKDIEDIEGAEALYSIPVRQFKYREDFLDMTDQRYNKVIPGFIVEEMIDIYPIAVDYNEEEPDKLQDWNMRFLIPPMLKLIQDQKEKIDELEQRIEILEEK